MRFNMAVVVGIEPTSPVWSRSSGTPQGREPYQSKACVPLRLLAREHNHIVVFYPLGILSFLLKALTEQQTHNILTTGQIKHYNMITQYKQYNTLRIKSQVGGYPMSTGPTLE